jgi:hypothetical protein
LAESAASGLAESAASAGGLEASVDPLLSAAPLRAHRPLWFEARALAAVALPGLYAWGATVAWPAFSVRSVAPLGRAAAVAAVVCLSVGLVLGRRRLVLGRAIGVLGFVGFSAATWGALGSNLHPPQLDPVRAALGTVAWGLFALGWGAFPGRTRLPEEDPHALAGRLQPRGRLSAPTRAAFLLLLLLGLALPLLAWRVERPGVALLAQAVALASSVGVLSVGTRVLLVRPGPGHGRPPRWALWGLAAWLLLGFLVWLF